MSENPVHTSYRTGPRVRELLRQVQSILDAAAIENARSEARDLVAALFGAARFWPTLNADAEAPSEVVARTLQAARLRASGAPFAYCAGKAAFRHLTLTVNERVLIPRQETEQLVELVLRHTEDHPGGLVADIGTGSGAIALSLATEGRDCFDGIIATDISLAALSIARQNAAAIPPARRCPVDFRSGDMFSCVSELGLRAVVSNPPYVAFEEAAALPDNVRNWEPPEALYSALNGMHAVQRLVHGGARALRSGGLLAIEVDTRRAVDAAELVMSSGNFENTRIELDLAGRERFVLATKGE